MKKTLALILAMLVAFSMFSVAAFAEDDLVTVTFVDYDGSLIKTSDVKVGEALTPYVPENPVREDTDTTKYTFRGWKSDIEGDDIVYNSSALNPADVDVTYTAVYLEEEVVKGQTLLQFFASIFERINLIFEYFATIFNFDLGE
jgi:hypothetical protein